MSEHVDGTGDNPGATDLTENDTAENNKEKTVANPTDTNESVTRTETSNEVRDNKVGEEIDRTNANVTNNTSDDNKDKNVKLQLEEFSENSEKLDDTNKDGADRRQNRKTSRSDVNDISADITKADDEQKKRISEPTEKEKSQVTGKKNAKNKVHPQADMAQGKATVEGTDSNTNRINGIKVMNILMSKKVKREEILPLLQSGADVNVRDEAGWYPLHFAALIGNIEIINDLMDHGAKSNCYDNNYHTPLHKAARRGHVDTVTALVAHGAQVDTRDWEGKVPLDFAVEGRHYNVVCMLFMFGAEPTLMDWTWTMKEEKNIRKEERDILISFKRQLTRIPGFKHGGISFEVACVKPGQDFKFKKLNAVLSVDHAKTPYFVYLSRLQSEYTDLKSYLKEEQNPFSDMYECKTWNLSRNVVTLALIVEGMPGLGELTDLVSPQGKIGRVENIQKMEETNQTQIDISLKLGRGNTQFAFALRKEPEKFQITKEAVVIQPQNEPEAAIDIPEGTFEHAAEMQFNVVETEDVNEDEESGPILLTNVIDLSMSDGQQPKKAIDMKLPIHIVDTSASKDMCVLTTSEEDPDDVDDWEILEAKPDPKGKFAKFKVSHFSIFVGATKEKASTEKKAIVEAAVRSLNRTKKIEFSIYLSIDPKKRGTFEMVIEISRPSKTAKRQEHWKAKGYELQRWNSEAKEIPENQIFKILFDKSIKNKSGDEDVFLEYEAKKKYKRLDLDMEVVNVGMQEVKVEAMITIEQEIIIDREIPTVKPSGCLFKPPKEIKEIVQEKIYEQFVKIPIGMKIAEEEPIEPIEKLIIKARRPSMFREVDDVSIGSEMNDVLKEFDKENTVPGLASNRLAAVAANISKDEGRNFANQLGINREFIETLMETDMSDSEFVFKLLVKYRGRRPHLSQIHSIRTALVKIGREDLIPFLPD